MNILNIRNGIRIEAETAKFITLRSQFHSDLMATDGNWNVSSSIRTRFGE